MVKLVEIEDNEGYESDSQYTTDSEDARSHRSLRSDAEDADQYESESDYEDDSDDDYLEESLLERLAALKDIVPVEHRSRVASAVGMVGRWGGLGAGLVGKLAWVFTTSALLVVFPLAIESDREKMMQQWEAEQGAQGGQAPQHHGAMPPGIMPGAPGGAPGLAPGVVA
ncbi:mitochondrial import receptor subunit Tom22 [Coemansia interrupta]|uniref:Mitochondrial import receptor subunit Tom22 n=1 Tax=Coemansia interrupta TaxID=1126814 RepID=A0A9W8LFY0_9FUNG|nr:mitochondrial import receptor subunit Tom22 [Coemansia interrupta]